MKRCDFILTLMAPSHVWAFGLNERKKGERQMSVGVAVLPPNQHHKLVCSHCHDVLTAMMDYVSLNCKPRQTIPLICCFWVRHLVAAATTEVTNASTKLVCVTSVYR